MKLTPIKSFYVVHYTLNDKDDSIANQKEWRLYEYEYS